MSRKNKKTILVENVIITDVAAEGKSLTRVNDMVVFVPFTVPGDIVDILIKKKKHNYGEAEVVKYVKLSDKREKPMCEHFGICGGCKWQNLPYEEQLKAKQKQVYDQLSRISHIKLPECNKILGSKKIKEYRNKLEFGCSNKKWLTKEQIQSKAIFDNMNAIGFHITGAFDKILPINKCCLMDNLHNKVRNEIYNYAVKENITFYDIKQQKGLLRSLMFRNNDEDEWMLLIQFHYDVEEDKIKAQNLLKHISDRFPEITSLLYVNNQKGNDTFNDLNINTYKGKDYIYEKMEDIEYKVGAKSFYQTNTQQALHLYEVARNFAQLTGTEIVYDLYTGTGTIANFIAKKAKKVIGIEYVPEAIEDAKENSIRNNINNTDFYAGDMKDILSNNFINIHGKPDVIITDPPRAGMHQDVIQTILNAEPQRIIYVSCNPATQARDLIKLDKKYKVVKIQPVDMFPHTPHVENVLLLEIK